MSFFSNIFGNSKKPRRIRNSRSSRPIAERKARLDFLALEERVVPAVTVSLTGSILQIGYGTAGDTATVTSDTLGNVIVNGTGLTTFSTAAASINQIAATGTGNSDAESLTFSASSTLALSAGFTSTGVATVNINSPLNVSNLSVNAADVTSNGNGTIAVSTLASFVQTGTDTLSGIITGAGGVTKDGSGTLVVNGASSFTGTITSNNGTLKLLKGGNVTVQDTGTALLNSATAGTTFNVPTTVSATNANTDLVLMVYGRTDGMTASATWQGTPMTLLTSRLSTATGPARATFLFVLKNPAVATGNIVLTSNVGANTSIDAEAFTLANVDNSIVGNPAAQSGEVSAGTFINSLTFASVVSGSAGVLLNGTNQNTDTSLALTTNNGTLRTPILLTGNDSGTDTFIGNVALGMTAGSAILGSNYNAVGSAPNKNPFSSAVFTPAPAFLTFANNVVYNANGTLDLGALNVDDSFGSLSLPNASTTMTLSGGRSDSFNGISSAGTGGTGNSIVSGTAAPIIALAPSSAVSVTGDPLTIGPVIGDFQHNGGAVVVTGVNKTGSGTLVLNGNNSYTGPTTLTSGILSIGSVANGGSPSALRGLLGGLIQPRLRGRQSAVHRPFGQLRSRLHHQPGRNATIDVGTSNRLTLTGSVPASTGSLTKIDTGSLILTGNELYTGLTSVNNGTLNLTGSVGGAVSVSGITSFLGTGVSTTFGGGLTSTGGTINVGGAGTTGTLTIGGDLNADAASTLNFDFLGTSLFDSINAQNVTLAAADPKIKIAGSNFVAGTYNIINFTGTYTGATPSLINTNPNFAFSFQKTSNALELIITPKVATPEWSWAAVPRSSTAQDVGGSAARTSSMSPIRTRGPSPSPTSTRITAFRTT